MLLPNIPHQEVTASLVSEQSEEFFVLHFVAFKSPQVIQEGRNLIIVPGIYESKL